MAFREPIDRSRPASVRIDDQRRWEFKGREEEPMAKKKTIKPTALYASKLKGPPQGNRALASYGVADENLRPNADFEALPSQGINMPIPGDYSALMGTPPM